MRFRIKYFKREKPNKFDEPKYTEGFIPQKLTWRGYVGFGQSYDTHFEAAEVIRRYREMQTKVTYIW